MGLHRHLTASMELPNFIYEATNWVNECAAAYYGVKTIATVDNYAGISSHPIGK
jgi:hypothetical protein